MNDIPSILVTDGWETDQNGALTEIVIPSTVDTYKFPTKVTFMGQTLAALIPDKNNLIEFSAPNMTSYIADGSSNMGSYSKLATVSMSSLITLGDTGGCGGAFASCVQLASVNFPKVQTVQGGGYSGTFYDCHSLIDVTLPNLVQVIGNYGYLFRKCTGLTTVQLGSTGHPVSSLHNNTFKDCTQANLTITIYTAEGASLSGEPWGATNADIVYEEA